MARRAAHADSAAIPVAAHHGRIMEPAFVVLSRGVAVGVAVPAARVQEDAAHFCEEGA